MVMNVGDYIQVFGANGYRIRLIVASETSARRDNENNLRAMEGVREGKGNNSTHRSQKSGVPWRR